MDVLVDVIRSEGCSAGRKALPLWLGEDGTRDDRERMNQIGSVMNEWDEAGAGRCSQKWYSERILWNAD
jgi:hypothetical protein